MLSFRADQQIYVYTEAVDMRKSINGLMLLLADTLEKNPQSGDFYVFTNRQRNKIKCLCWDQNGFVLYYKRLERGRFHYSKYLVGNEILVSEQQLQGLLMGLDFYLLGTHPAQEYSSFF